MSEQGNPMGLKPQKLRKKTRIFTRKKVLKMLAVMEQQRSGENLKTHSQEFLSSGRTGRRNALPDILGEHAVVTSADLPARLQTLTTNDGASTSQPQKDADIPGTSKQAESKGGS